MAPHNSGWWPVLGTHAAVSLIAIALASAAVLASKSVTVTATGPEHRQPGAAVQSQEQLRATALAAVRERQQQQAAAHRATALQNRRSAPSSSVNVLGSPFISTPVGLQPGVADVAALEAAAAAQARSAVNATAQRTANLVQQPVLLPVPSSMVNVMGNPFLTTAVPVGNPHLPVVYQNSFTLMQAQQHQEMQYRLLRHAPMLNYAAYMAMNDNATFQPAAPAVQQAVPTVQQAAPVVQPTAAPTMNTTTAPTPTMATSAQTQNTTACSHGCHCQESTCTTGQCHAHHSHQPTTTPAPETTINGRGRPPKSQSAKTDRGRPVGSTKAKLGRPIGSSSSRNTNITDAEHNASLDAAEEIDLQRLGQWNAGPGFKAACGECTLTAHAQHQVAAGSSMRCAAHSCGSGSHARFAAAVMGLVLS